MNQKIKIAMDKFFHDSAIAELRLLNNGTSDSRLTYNDVLYLSMIEAHPGEYTASKLADMLFVSRPAVTQKVNELERQGYLHKVKSATDKRVYHLFTNKADAAKSYYSVVDKTNEDIVRAVSQAYTKEEIDLFCRMTDTICGILLEETKKVDS